MKLIFSKICTQCKVKQDFQSFGKNKSQTDGHHYYCKACVKKQVEKHKEKNQEWHQKNKQKVKQYQREYRDTNREKLNQYQCSRPIEKKRKANCSEKKKQRAKERRQDEAQKKNSRLYYFDKYKNDPQYKTKKILEARLRALVKKNDETVKARNLLGCTVPEFKVHIESKFAPTMSWENYGSDWQFDI